MATANHIRVLARLGCLRASSRRSRSQLLPHLVNLSAVNETSVCPRGWFQLRTFSASATESVFPSEKYEFQTETRRVLDIVTNSLYTDKEVFVRELISNASDALEKGRHLALTAEGIDSGIPLEISLAVDKEAGTLTISDSGVGMDQEELMSNLGTIARSGTKAFVQSLEETDAAPADAKANMIGKFGVGFYSSFMVANKVEVHTKSIKPESTGWCWESEGDGSFTITADPLAGIGTRIVLHLKDDAKNFADIDALKGIIKKYSNFVTYPILLAGERVNTVQAIWSKPAQDISEEEHTEFYQFITNAFDEPKYHFKFSSDAPLTIQSLFYIPSMNTEKFISSRENDGLTLYSRKVLIQHKVTDLLPGYLRFVRGVVDCEDVPLNISRESTQDSALLRRLREVLTTRLLRFLEQEAKKDPEKYDEFFTEFGMRIKEGICEEQAVDKRQRMAKLLRCESSKTDPGMACSLEEYVARSPEKQKDIYYIVCASRDQALQSPYLEAFDAAGIEVLFFYSGVDEFVMTHLKDFNGKVIKCVEAPGVEPPEKSAASADKESEQDDTLDETSSEQKDAEASAAEHKDVCEWLKEHALSGRVGVVRVSTRLVGSPAIVVGHTSASMRRMTMLQMQMGAGHKDLKGLGMDMDSGVVGDLEINPNHAIIKQLKEAHTSEDEKVKALAADVAVQMFDNARIAAGILDDPSKMLGRLNTILASVLPSSSS